MSDESPKKFYYESCTYLPIPGTEDWVGVADLGEGGYSWAELKAFYSPTAHRYFWHGDRGCSCSGWADDLTTSADFKDGDRDALLRAWEAFAKENHYDIQVTDYLTGVQTIKEFKEPTA